MKLWHCSPIANHDSIEARGLVPSWYPGSPELGPSGYHHEPIHLAEEAGDPDFILDLHECDEVDVYEVEISYLTLHPGGDGPGTFTVYEWIQPERLTHKFRQDRQGNVVWSA